MVTRADHAFEGDIQSMLQHFSVSVVVIQRRKCVALLLLFANVTFHEFTIGADVQSVRPF